MKKKLSVFCSLLLVVQMILSMATVPVFAENDESAAAYTELESPTVTYNMNVDWKYKRAADNATFPLASAATAIAKDGKNFYDADYDDSDWETVSLPHAVNAEDSFDGLGIDAGEASVYRGFMFYRKSITVPATDAGKKFILEFEAFRQSVYVYINGTMAGYYEAGVAPVGFDLTDYIKPGEKNVIAVATDNSSSRGNDNPTVETIPGTVPGSRTGVGYQWNTKDFNEVQGGLTGNVKLHAKNKLYQTLPLYSNMKTTGNYVYASNFDIRGKSADITVEAEVRNETKEEKEITLQVDIVDSDGNLTASFSKTADVAAATDTDKDQFLTVVPETAYKNGEGQENNNVDISTVEVTKITATENVADLKFWSDASPNMYTVYTYLKDGEDVIDTQKIKTGFREIVYDKDKGLQINGTTTYLKGYAQRSTNEWAAIGVANDWLSDIDMQLVKESNANFIRWMHIAPNPVDIRAGDKYGVVSVVPAGDKEGDASGRAWDQRVETMRDVIIYFRNNPSVVFWEAGNNAISAAHMKEMTDLRKKLDPSADRFMGCRTISSVEQIKEAEWAGTMIYRHDDGAYASMQSTGNYIPMVETEYHRNEAPRRVWDDYSPPYYDYVNKWLGAGGSKTDGYDMWDQTQEDFSRSMLGSGDCYSYFYNNRVGGSGKNYYSAAAMMVWSDSNMHVRNCGVENARTSGRVDAIRIKKESFYAIQAAQSTTPKIHILGHWNYPKYIAGDKENGNYWYEDKKWNGTYWESNGTMLQRDPTKKTVYVIGSEGISKVELYINDTLAGTDKSPDDNFVYAFPNIDVTQSGKVTAKAYNERDEVVAEHEIKTAGEAATIKLTPVTGPKGLLADGSDYAYVDVAVVDADGNVCPLDERKITFSVSDESKAEFIGGYNSGYYGDGLKGAGDRIVNHKNYVFAECGVNRVFVKATRNAGEFTLTATAEGMQPVSITLKSNEVVTEGGLTTDEAQYFEQGEVVQTPPPVTAPSLKSLGETFTADWTEGTGNVVKVNTDTKDYYTVKVNNTEVGFTDKAYRPGGSGVVAEINPILDALKAKGADIDYTFATEGDIPEEFIAEGGKLPLITITSGDKKIYFANGSTTYLNSDGEKNLMNFQTIANSGNTALIAELSAVFADIDGVSVETDEENKVFAVTVDTNEKPEKFENDFMKYENGRIKVTAANGKLENAVLIMAGYNKDGSLNKVTIDTVTVENGTTSDAILVNNEIRLSNNIVAMLWSDIKNAKPVCDTLYFNRDSSGLVAGGTDTASLMSDELMLMADDTEPVVDKVYQYDTIMSDNKCDAAVTGLTLSSDTSPDGTKYLTGGTGDVCMSGLSANSTADILWETDIRFDADGAGVTPRDNGNKKYGTCIRRHGNKLAIQTGESSYKDYIDIDSETWYHIALIGRYSAADANIDMIVYKYEGSERVYIDTYKSVNTRNLYANNGSGASHWDVHPNTSVDNMRITMLGADILVAESDSDSIKAGNTMQFNYSATRQNEYITNPSVKWEIYNAANTALADDASITISNAGILNVGLDAKEQTINVRATADSGVYASKQIAVKAVDISNVKFDTLTLSTDAEYVSADKPMTIKATATKGGESVALTDSDLIWYAADAADMMKLGDNLKWIKIENGVVTVDKKAVSQDITIRAADPKDTVRGSLKIHIKSTDALENGEEGTLDKLLTADNCEAVLANTEFVESVDGTHAYKATAGYSTGNITSTAGDVVVEMDIKFTQEGAGFQPAKEGKINTCVVYHDGQLCVQTGGSSYTKYGDISPDKWYHITLIRKMSAYAHMILEEYDENGERTNRRLIKDVSQRNDRETAFVNINVGTAYDNLRILTPTPTDIEIATDIQTVFAGNTVQATATLLWNGLEMKNPDASIFEYKIYDSENKYTLDSDKITVNSLGVISVDAMADAQDVYVRAVAKQSGKYASAKFTVQSSDIFAITKLGVNQDDENNLAKLFVTKNFYYKDEVTFVIKVYDENGALTKTYLKEIYGDALKIGENEVTIDINLPSDFDKTKDTIKIYPVTKLWADDAAIPNGSLKAERATSSAVLTAVPEYDSGTDVVILVLKAGADETNVKENDILYFEVVNSLTSGYEIKLSQTTNADYTIKTGGMIKGVHTVCVNDVEVAAN